MNTKFTLAKRAALALLSTFTAFYAAQLSTVLAQGTAFTYQGRLNSGGSPANGTYDLQFTIYDSTNQPGTVIAGPLTNSATAVSNGLFTVTLDFGANVFTGPDRWLESAVRTNGGGAFAALSPRQKLTATPYAVTAANVTGVIPGSALSGIYSGPVTFNNGANVFAGALFAGTFNGAGAGLTSLDAGHLASGTVPDARLAANVARTNQVWLLGGNAGANPTNGNFLGTMDNLPLELRANGLRALRLEPATNSSRGYSPNVIGGYQGNTVAPGVIGATIAGGGRFDISEGDALAHHITAHHGTIGGGDRNTVNGEDGTIAGGGGHVENGPYSSIGGGVGNKIQTNSYYATIGGGAGNSIETNSSSTTIAGGYSQTIRANTTDATIGGGSYDSIGTNSFGSTISGGGNNTVGDNSRSSTIGGGYGNNSLAQYATVGGGGANSSTGYSATIGGGYFNTSGGDESTVGGGANNSASGAFATVAGGTQNLSTNNSTTVGGGFGNVSGGLASTVGGGNLNTNTGDFATVGGGRQNLANGSYGHIGGGFGNRSGPYATVAGGISNTATNSYATVGGGSGNTGSGLLATVSGGSGNTGSGLTATVPGGTGNTAAGNYSFAAGFGAQAGHDGAFVWADSSGASFASTAPNQFLIRASGGVGINTDNPAGAALNVAGTVRATAFQGDGSGLTNLASAVGNYVFSYDTSTQPVTTPNTFQDVSFGTDALINGWTHSIATQFASSRTGLYLIQYTAEAMSNVAGTSAVSVRATLNGTEIAGSQAVADLDTSLQVLPVSRSFIAGINVSDILKLQYTGSTINCRLFAGEGAGVTKPSVSLTITRIQ